MTRTKAQATEDRRWRRGDFLAVLGAVVLGGVLASIIMSIQNLQRDLQVANQARDALATQVQSLGATPIAGKPGSRGDIGPSGPPGPPGPQGEPGVPGSPAPIITPAPGPRGPQGLPGLPGANSTIPGPAGPAGAPGQDGADGTDGTDGRDGVDGEDGTDGKNGEPPMSWTYTDGSGTQYRCTRTSPFDPAVPKYTCSAVATGSPAKGAVGIAVLASIAAYRRIGSGQRWSLESAS